VADLREVSSGLGIPVGNLLRWCWRFICGWLEKPDRFLGRLDRLQLEVRSNLPISNPRITCEKLPNWLACSVVRF
jgi:hypothetical protein